MEQLNIECLQNIIKYLNLRDKINLALSSEKFWQLFIQWSKRHLKAIKSDMVHCMTIEEEKTLIQLIGANFESYEMSSDVLVELTVYCKKLKRLDLLQNYDDSTQSRQKISRLCNLQYLECFTYDNYTATKRNYEMKNYTPNSMMEFLVQTLAKLPKLRSVSLWCSNYEGKYLDTLTKVEHLELSESPTIRSKYFTAACKNIKNLRRLDLPSPYGGNVNDLHLLAISLHCQNLEKLVLSVVTGELEEVFDLPKLKYLAIKNTGLMDRLEILAAKKSGQLECLKLFNVSVNPGYAKHIGQMRALRELYCALEVRDIEVVTQLRRLEYLTLDCFYMSNAQALRIIEMCPNLIYFGVNSFELNESLITEATNILLKYHSNGLRRKDKLIIGFTNEIWNKFKDLKANNLIELSNTDDEPDRYTLFPTIFKKMA